MVAILPELAGLIHSAAVSCGLDPRLISAIVMQETHGNPWLTRFEPAWQYWENPIGAAARLGITSATERTLQAMSWGPMQLMGSVARELGFEAELTRLTDPAVALSYSCRKLAALRAKYPASDDAIAAWNAGSPRRDSTGAYVNQHYVDGVNAFLRASLGTS